MSAKIGYYGNGMKQIWINEKWIEISDEVLFDIRKITNIKRNMWTKKTKGINSLSGKENVNKKLKQEL